MSTVKRLERLYVEAEYAGHRCLAFLISLAIEEARSIAASPSDDNGRQG